MRNNRSHQYQQNTPRIHRGENLPCQTRKIEPSERKEYVCNVEEGWMNRRGAKTTGREFRVFFDGEHGDKDRARRKPLSGAPFRTVFANNRFPGSVAYVTINHGGSSTNSYPRRASATREPLVDLCASPLQSLASHGMHYYTTPHRFMSLTVARVQIARLLFRPSNLRSRLPRVKTRRIGPPTRNTQTRKN